MRAVTVSDYGSPPELAEVPEPAAGPGQILISIAAAGMNPIDSSLASGEFKPAPATFPMILGVDCAGTVAGLGRGVRGFSIGDRVFGQLLVPPIGSAGTYADYVSVTAEAPLCPVPTELGFIEAAAIPTAGTTALALVDSLGSLDADTVLITGAGGGVGSFISQFVVKAGAKVLANVNSEAEDRLRSYGVAETLDGTAARLPQAVRRSHPDGVDVLIDLVADAATFKALATLVRPGGTAVSTRYAADSRALSALGINGVNFVSSHTRELLERVAGAVVAGRITMPPITRIPLDEVPTFMATRTRRHSDGKVVVVLYPR